MLQGSEQASCVQSGRFKHQNIDSVTLKAGNHSSLTLSDENDAAHLAVRSMIVRIE